MTQERLKIFLSAVTSDFGVARDKIRSDLSARDRTVRVQSDFRQDPNSDTLLGMLANYIRDCHAVICVVGKRSGASPPARATESRRDVLPAGIKEASYTQWEYFLARHYKRRTFVYIAQDDYKPDKDAVKGDRFDLQSAFVEFLKAEGVRYTPFPTAEELRIAVLRDEHKSTADPVADDDGRATSKPIVLPYPSIRELFKGRDEFMARLRESLKRTHGARTAIVSQALYGLGGIGKTRVAVEYAWANADEYNALLFVIAETSEALRRNLAALSTTLTPQLDTTEDTVKLAAVLDWLKANPGWLLILDNVDSKPALAEVERLLSGLGGGHVVVTSRLADFSGHFQPLELNVLAIDDAAVFLLERTKDRRRVTTGDEALVREVAEELGGLALALEQAAAFIGVRRLTFAQYLEQWRAKRDEVLAWFGPTITDYPRTVAVTWQTSVAQLTEGGRGLLERLAWLAPEKVPESLLDVPIAGAESENLRAAYDDLAVYSLVTRDAEGPFFLVHRLVQDVTRRSLAGEARQRSLVETLVWINAAFPFDSDDVRFWPQAEPLAPHALNVTARADAAGIAEPTARLMSQLALLLQAKALHAEAEPLMRRALAIVETSFGPDHPQVAIRLNNLALLLQATSRLAEAEPLMRRALAIDEKSLGSDHRDVARDLNNLALLLKDTNHLTEAEPLMRRALAIGEKEFGPDHPTVALRLNNLGQLLQDTNRLAEAEPLMRRVVSILEKSLELDHPNVATALSNLAVLLQDTNRLAEAEPLIRRALAIDEKSFGPDHPTVALRLNNLAQLLKATNRIVEADPLMQRALAIFVEFTRRTGHRHPRLDLVIANYKILLKAMGKSQAEIDDACAAFMRPLPEAVSAPARSAEDGGGGRGRGR